LQPVTAARGVGARGTSPSIRAYFFMVSPSPRAGDADVIGVVRPDAEASTDANLDVEEGDTVSREFEIRVRVAIDRGREPAIATVVDVDLGDLVEGVRESGSTHSDLAEVGVFAVFVRV